MSIWIWLATSWMAAFAQTPVESILNEDTIRALRDPFHAPNISLQAKEAEKSDLELYALKDFRLNGVMTGIKKPKALISLPNSKTFFISVGDKIGVREGKVVMISNDFMKVVEFDHDESGKKVPEYFKLMISGEIVALTDKEER